MKRKIVQTKQFENDIASLIAKRKLSAEDFEIFKRKLAEDPAQGDVIPGTGGIRKTRLKSTSRGKSGGFRVCYLNLADELILFLLFIYSKNEQADLSQSEKLDLKKVVDSIKRRASNEQIL